MINVDELFPKRCTCSMLEAMVEWKPFTDLDKWKIVRAVKWLMGQQQEDGSFAETMEKFRAKDGVSDLKGYYYLFIMTLTSMQIKFKQLQFSVGRITVRIVVIIKSFNGDIYLSMAIISM